MQVKDTPPPPKGLKRTFWNQFLFWMNIYLPVESILFLVCVFSNLWTGFSFIMRPTLFFPQKPLCGHTCTYHNRNEIGSYMIDILHIDHHHRDDQHHRNEKDIYWTQLTYWLWFINALYRSLNTKSEIKPYFTTVAIFL